MESLYGFFALLSLLLFASSINARTAPEEYWKQVMKDQPMPDALNGLVDSNPSEPISKDMIKTDCHTSLNTQDNIANNIQTDPVATAVYDDHVKQKENENTNDNKAKTFLTDAGGLTAFFFYGHDATKDEDQKAFVKDFEPRPNLSVYHA